MILKHRETDEYRYFIPYLNSTIFDQPITISNQADLEKTKARILTLNFSELSVICGSPDTKWSMAFITNINITAYRMNYLFGTGLLPHFLKKLPSLMCLDLNRNGHTYYDNLCMFRCISFWEHGFTEMEANTIKNYAKWRRHINPSLQKKIPENPKDFKGVKKEDFPELEQCFDFNMWVMTRNEDETIDMIYKPCEFLHTKSIHLHLYADHLSYIRDFKQFARKFKCPTCDKHFKTIKELKRHMPACPRLTRRCFPGGFHKQPRTLQQKLKSLGINETEKSLHLEYYAAFDFESILMGSTLENTNKTQFSQHHVPVSVSIASNIPGHTNPKCFINTDPSALVEEMITYLNVLQSLSYRLNKNKISNILAKIIVEQEKYASQEAEHVDAESCNADHADEERGDVDHGDAENVDAEHGDAEHGDAEYDAESRSSLQKQLSNTMSSKKWRLDDGTEYLFEITTEEIDKMGDEDTKMREKLHNMKAKLELHCSQLPIFGFNSKSYDLNLIMTHLAKEFVDSQTFIVKQSNKYVAVKSSKFSFLDATSYLAVGVNYASFLKAYGIEESKSFFPYEWFDSYEKLDNESLPNYDAFYSELKQTNVLNDDYEKWEKTKRHGKPPKTGAENYRQLQKIWLEREMQKFSDFLEYYNNLDTGPFILALDKMISFYREINVDLLTEAISVPGIARRILLDSARKQGAYFSLFSNQNDDLHDKLRKNCFGGPSIIFNRRIESGITKTPAGEIIRRIHGYDANSLYLWSFDQEHGTGCFVRRRAENEFKAERHERYMLMYLWMEHLSKKEGIRINHKMNSGYEQRIKEYLLDGYCIETDTAYEFNGCWYVTCN